MKIHDISTLNEWKYWEVDITNRQLDSTSPILTQSTYWFLIWRSCTVTSKDFSLKNPHQILWNRNPINMIYGVMKRIYKTPTLIHVDLWYSAYVYIFLDWIWLRKLYPRDGDKYYKINEIYFYIILRIIKFKNCYVFMNDRQTIESNYTKKN